LPAPDAVFYFKISLETALEHLRRREAETGSKADIHELDAEHLARSLQSAGEAAAIYGWHIIDCMENGRMRGVSDIHNEVVSIFESRAPLE
jgi:dTMP kinase